MADAIPLRFFRALPLAAFATVSLMIGGLLADDPAQSPLDRSKYRRSEPLRFGRDVVPALTKAGCNAGACHGSFQGRGGFTLSLLGFDPAVDFQAIAKAARGRRVNVGSPEHSLLLRKPLASVPHGGGQRITDESEVANLLREWIAQGMPPPQADDLAGLTIAVEPREILFPDAHTNTVPAPLQVAASFGDGTTRDVTPWALFDARDRTIATVTRDGQVSPQRPGKTSITIRYGGQVATVSVMIPFGPPTTFEFASTNPIDAIAADEWKRLGLVPAPVCDDATFVRRVHLDLIGTLPTSDEVRAFLSDAAADKRARLVDALLERPEYVDYWTLRWGDLLRAHRRYLGDKGLTSFNGWIRQSIRENKPLDVMTREIITSQGNLFTNGPVGYYFIDEKVEDLAETTSQVFLGVRLQCTKCHHHPNEVWSQSDYYGLAAFFTQLETKDSGAAGARFGGPKSLRVASVPNPNRKPLMTVEPRAFGETAAPGQSPESDGDPRRQLAQWMTNHDNPYFARNFVNRYWAALFGIGLVEPVDDMRATNPASLPALLDALADDFKSGGYDAKRLLRTICQSRTYQLAVELNPVTDTDGALFTHRAPRRHSAEVLLDAINQATGCQETFAGQPEGTRAIALPDPTIASRFLTTFGRPQRNSACECARGSKTDLSQVLQLANSEALQQKIAAPTGWLATWLKTGRDDDAIADEAYLRTLSRLPNDNERTTLKAILGEGASREEAWQDIVWALLNSSEFLMSH